MSVSNKQQRVLIVEDNPELADLFAMWLSTTYHVDTAYKPEEALRKLDSSVDIILLDRQISNYSGPQVIQEVRDDRSHIRVAVITATEPEFDDYIVETEFDDYIVKPVSCEDLIEVTSDLVTREQYTELINNLHRLSKKKALLEERNSQTELDNSEEYRRTVNQLKSIRKHADRAVRDINEKKAFSELS
jgi:two-component system response regulator AdeR